MTKKKILSKWKWIHSACMELGLVQSGAIALEIDDLLTVLYLKTHTRRWKRCMEHHPPQMTRETIKDVARQSAYCIACVESNYDCKKCKFYSRGGMLFTKFRKEINREEEV